MDDEKPRCKMCETLGGVFGLLLGVTLLFISFDVLTNGSISNLISGRAPEETTDVDES